MQTTIKLQNLFSYSLIPILIILVVLAIFLAVYIFIVPKYIKVPIPKTIPIPKNPLKIKEKYLKEINDLIIKVNSNAITNRKAFQELSLLIRKFIFEMTTIRVQNCTLEEIKPLNMPYLYALVEEYYDPEFAKISKGNILNSINKTKEVIEKWN